MPKLPKVAIGAIAAVGVFLISTVLLIVAKKPGIDVGGTVPSTIQATSPGLRQDALTPVGTEEASKRVAANKEDAAATANDRGGAYVAKPVIEKKVDITPDNKEQYDGPPAATPIPAVAKPNLAVLSSEAAPAAAPATQAQQQQPPPNTDFINKQLTALIGDPQPMGPPNFLVVHFAKPPKKEAPAGGGAEGGRDGAAGYRGPKVLAAKPGDVFYAVVNVGFNSDDPQGLPVYATIYDIHPDGSTGPLHGARLAGKVTYSEENAAVVFNQMTLGDNTGRTAQVSAMAVTIGGDVRPGVAVDVDNHVLSRYGSLAAASLIKGLGEVGQQLVSRVGTMSVSPYGVYTSSLDFNNPSVYVPAAMGALQPMGQVFTQAMSKNFMRRPTISTPEGTDVGIVFMESVIVPVVAPANYPAQAGRPQQ